MVVWWIGQMVKGSWRGKDGYSCTLIKTVGSVKKSKNQAILRNKNYQADNW